VQETRIPFFVAFVLFVVSHYFFTTKDTKSTKKT